MEKVKEIKQWWNVSPNKEMYDFYEYGILSERLQKELDNIINPFKIKE